MLQNCNYFLTLNKVFCLKNEKIVWQFSRHFLDKNLHSAKFNYPTVGIIRFVGLSGTNSRNIIIMNEKAIEPLWIRHNPII